MSTPSTLKSIIGIYNFADVNQYTRQIITSNAFILVNMNQVTNKKSLFPTLYMMIMMMMAFNLYSTRKEKDMWREYEKKLHLKLISIGKSLVEDDMMDSDTTGK